MSSTIEKITTKQKAIATKQSRLTELKTNKSSLEANLDAQYRGQKSCKGVKAKSCRSGFDAPISNAIAKIKANAAEQKALVEEISRLNAQLKTLNDQLKVEQKNSAIVTETLAQQGKTVESVEVVAETEAEAQAEAVILATKMQAETNAVAARSAAEQELAQDAEANRMTQLIIAVVVVVALYFVYTKFIKK